MIVLWCSLALAGKRDRAICAKQIASVCVKCRLLYLVSTTWSFWPDGKGVSNLSSGRSISVFLGNTERAFWRGTLVSYDISKNIFNWTGGKEKVPSSYLGQEYFQYRFLRRHLREEFTHSPNTQEQKLSTACGDGNRKSHWKVANK